MTRTDKALLYTIIAASLPIVVGIVLVVSPRSQASRNQVKIAWSLVRANAVASPAAPQEILAVTLGDGTALSPEVDQVVAGYIVRLHVRSNRFTIEALPAKVGETGLLSFFRDEEGVIRFETSGRRASATSRPVTRPAADGVR